MSVSGADRFTGSNQLTCPVCDGAANLPRGKGERCWGYKSGEMYVFCTNDRHRGNLDTYKDTNAFRHFLGGPCNCGATHDNKLAPVVNINSFKSGSGARSNGWWDWPVKAIYEYHREDGSVAYRVPKRVNPADPADKAFPPETPDGKGGWKTGLNGQKQLLFHLPQLLAADPAIPIHLTEGEKDVLTVENLGYVASCNTGGGGHWHSEFNYIFKGRDVIIHQDNDSTGERHTTLLLKNLLPVVRSIKVITYSELSEHGDVTDYLVAGHTKEDLEARIQQTQVTTELPAEKAGPEKTKEPGGLTLPEMISAFDLLGMDLPAPAFLIEGLLPDIGTAIIGGAAGIGKSMLSFNMARDLVLGRKFLGQYQCQPAGVLYLSLESNQRRDQFRLKKMLGQISLLEREKLKNLHIVWDWQPLSEVDGGLAQFDMVLEQHPEIKVVIVDIMQAARPVGRPNRSDAYQEFYAWGHKIRKYAFDKSKVIIFVHHTNKGKWENPFDAFSGATSVAGTMNTKFMLKEKNPETHEYELEYRGNDVDRGKLALMFDGETYTFTSQGDAVVKEVREERQEIIKVLVNAGHRGMTPKEVADHIGKERIAVQRLLGKMLDERQVKQVSYGYYALPDKNNYLNNGNSGNSGYSGNQGNSSNSYRSEINGNSWGDLLSVEDTTVTRVTGVTTITNISEIPIPDGLGVLGERAATNLKLASTEDEIDNFVNMAEFDILDTQAYQRFVRFANKCKEALTRSGQNVPF